MKILYLAGGLVLAAAACILIPDAYYRASSGRGCSRCHEIGDQYRGWMASTHRSVACETCHESTVWTNVRRVVTHFSGKAPEQPHLRTADVFQVFEKCQGCHQSDYAAWRAGPHSITYAKVFLDAKHNSRTRLRDDCLRCHGMHFQGSISALVQPVKLQGPWKLVDPTMADRPALPCLTCHSIHREGVPLKRPAAGRRALASAQELARPSIALFDRREQRSLPLGSLPLPKIMAGDRPVRMSPDRRQAMCYQCHAPEPGAQAGSGDDRTPLGVHEGLSCLACHQRHKQTTRVSCATCHPRLSNCGLDVERMDTTFLNPDSTHNIHTVKCADCHPKGVPARRTAQR